MTTEKLLFAELTYKVRGAIFKVYNQLGFGHKENIYLRALAHELTKQEIPFEQEKPLNVIYDGVKVGTYRPDFVIDGKILLELKALLLLPKQAETQLIYYLKGTNYKLGLLVNFGANELHIKRKIWTGYPRKSIIRGNPPSIRDNQK